MLVRENLATMDSVIVDEEGFLLCAIHRQRRYGWRSVPVIEVQGGRYHDWRFASWTPLEVEASIVFGEVPRPNVLEIHDIPDQRMNLNPLDYVDEVHTGGFEKNSPQVKTFWRGKR